MGTNIVLPSQDELTDQLAIGLDPTLLDLAKTKFNSFIKWDLARFFHTHPHVRDSAENIAQSLYQKRAAVEQGLEELAESGLMEKNVHDGKPIYSLVGKEEKRALVDKFALATEDRYFRIVAVYQMVPGMR